MLKLPNFQPCRVLLLTVLMVSLQPALAQEATVDKRIRSEPANYEISFCARPSPGATGLPGHAFVTFSQVIGQTAGGADKRSFVSLGRSTDESGFDVIHGKSVKGFISEENYSHEKQRCLVVLVNQEAYESAFALTRPLLERLGIANQSYAGRVYSNYDLGENDCVTFVMEVASIVGIEVLDRDGFDNFPMKYLEALREANAG